MRKHILITSVLLILISYVRCSKLDCLLVSRELTENEKMIIPANLYDTIYYTNSTDTNRIICISREYNEKSEYYADKYFQADCGQNGQETRYWELSTKYETDIKCTDTSDLVFELSVKTAPDLAEDGIFVIKFYEEFYEWPFETIYLYISPDNPEKLLRESPESYGNPSYFLQGKVAYHNQMLINNHLYTNVNVLSGSIGGYDSLYYNNKFGIIRLTNKNGALNILRKDVVHN